LTLVVYGFASETWKQMSRHDTTYSESETEEAWPNGLNLALAEGRRAFVVNHFRNNSRIKIASGNGGVPSFSGGRDVQFSDYATLNTHLSQWFKTASQSKGSEIMKRSVVISYDEKQLLQKCGGPL